MKKAMKLFLIMFLVVTMVACSCGRKDDDGKDNNQDETENQEEEEPLKNETDLKQGDIKFEDIKIEYEGAINIVSATVSNTGSKTVSFKAVLYMKNADDRTLGKIDQTIESLDAGESAEISVQIMGDYRTVETFEVVIENLEEL